MDWFTNTVVLFAWKISENYLQCYKVTNFEMGQILCLKKVANYHFSNLVINSITSTATCSYSNCYIFYCFIGRRKLFFIFNAYLWLGRSTIELTDAFSQAYWDSTMDFGFLTSWRCFVPKLFANCSGYIASIMVLYLVPEFFSDNQKNVHVDLW